MTKINLTKIGLGVRFACWALLLGAGFSVAAGDAVAATKVGVTAAVNPAATGRAPKSKERILYVGVDMQANERVRTGANGRVQLLFQDGSAMTIGPNSELVIDEFVYDPKMAEKPGKLAFSVAKGVFRFVGGKISKRSTVRIKTPGATLGIRGGVALIDATLGKYILLFGCLEVGRTSFCRPGFAVDRLPDGSLSAPRLTTPAEIRKTQANFQAPLVTGLAQIAPAGGGTGGQQQGTIDGRLAASGISQANSDKSPGQLTQPTSTLLSSGQNYYRVIANRNTQIAPVLGEEIIPEHTTFKKFKFHRRHHYRRHHYRRIYYRRHHSRRIHSRRIYYRRIFYRRIHKLSRHVSAGMHFQPKAPVTHSSTKVRLNSWPIRHRRR